jgi:hypothetical protein
MSEEKALKSAREIVHKRLENPNAAFAYLISYFEQKNERTIDELLTEWDTKESWALNQFGTVLHYFEHLNAAIEAYRNVDEKTEYIVSVGFQSVYKSTLEAIERYTQELVLKIMQDETGQNHFIQYGSGSAWGNEKDSVPRAAQKLFEIQDIYKRWEAVRALKKQRSSQE